ncbi:hypothetical protein M0657_001217 [Pyricularia oryzae]|nr:hypothetical protein M9X92_004201 [Pyricularia oryzae]KAI7931263.1 hypothetical protein M0657_001217 [Pyricularia oryzae]
MLSLLSTQLAGLELLQDGLSAVDFYDAVPCGLGDTCQSISQSQGVTTAWLLCNNGLPAFCADFPTSSSLCIQNRYALYTVKADDTCLSIASSRSLAQVQLTTWNPILGNLCRSVNNSIGDPICMSPPGEPDYIVPPYPNTTTNCALYHFVVAGEYYNKLVGKYSISLPDFMFLNPHVNAGCTNLWKDTSYCVKAIGSIDEYLGHPDYVSRTTYATVPYGSLARSRSASQLVRSPRLATGTNPSLPGNSISCAPQPGYRYCMAQWDGASFTKSPKPIETPTLLPIRESATPECKAYQSVITGFTRQSVLDRNCITIA